MYHLALYFVFILIDFFNVAAGLSCYECNIKEDVRCLIMSEEFKQPTKLCLPHNQACRIFKKVYKDSGEILAFSRGCYHFGEDTVNEDSTYITYIRYCTTDECNIGNGNESQNDDTNERIVAILVADLKAAGHRRLSYLFLLLPPLLMYANL